MMVHGGHGARRGDLVVLVHGLGRSGRSLARLERAVRGAGFRTFVWDDPSRRRPLGELAARLRDGIAGLGESGTVHFAAHSLGGLLIRGALAEPAPVQAGRIVMIATPNRGVHVGGGGAGLRLAELIYGRPVVELAGPARDLPGLGVPKAEIGVIAGTKRFHPVNPTSYINALWRRGSAHHDGTVEVDRTRLAGMRDFVLVDAHHTFICDDPEAIRQAIAFLRTGAFDHGAENRRAVGA